MKIHPNGFTLEEFLVSLSRQHLDVVEHLVGCATCRRRFQGLIRQRSLSQRSGDVLPWRGAPEPEYGPALTESGLVFLDRERAMAAGYQRHLAKPVDPSDLVDMVAELADRAAAIDGVRTIGD